MEVVVLTKKHNKVSVTNKPVSVFSTELQADAVMDLHRREMKKRTRRIKHNNKMKGMHYRKIR